MYETSVSDFKSSARKINFFLSKARRETITAETMREKAKIPAVYETKDSYKIEGYPKKQTNPRINYIDEA